MREKARVIEKRRGDIEQYQKFGAIKRRLHEMPEFQSNKGIKLPDHELPTPSSNRTDRVTSSRPNELENQREVESLKRQLQDAFSSRKKRRPNDTQTETYKEMKSYESTCF